MPSQLSQLVGLLSSPNQYPPANAQPTKSVSWFTFATQPTSSLLQSIQLSQLVGLLSPPNQYLPAKAQPTHALLAVRAVIDLSLLSSFLVVYKAVGWMG